MCRVLVRMMRMEKRIVRLVALDDWECQNKVIYKWVEDVMDSLEKFM